MLELVTPDTETLFDYSDPVNFDQPLNRGLDRWFLALPEWRGGVMWRDLCRRKDGTLTNMVPATAWIGSRGRQGGWGALEFDGTDDRINIGNLTILGDGTSDNPISISCWAKLDSTDRAVFVGTDGAGGDNVNDSILFGTDASNRLAFALYDSSLTNRIGRLSTSAMTTGSWDHYFATYDGSSTEAGIRLFKNGVELSTSSDSAGSYTATAGLRDWWIGARWPNAGNIDRHIDGQVDDVRIHRRKLSPLQVREQYNASSLGYPGLLNRLPLLFGTKPILGAVPSGYTLQKRRHALAVSELPRFTNREWY